MVRLLGWHDCRRSVERLAAIEEGELEPDLDTLRTIAATLDCGVDRLLCRQRVLLVTEDVA